MTRRTVTDVDGNRYILLKQSSESSLVRNPETGERTHLPNESLQLLEEEGPLDTAVRQIPEPVRVLLKRVPDEQALGLLLELDADGPMAVRGLLTAYDLCESDLHGYLMELRAGGLVTETTVVGERGYRTTEEASDLLEAVTD